MSKQQKVVTTALAKFNPEFVWKPKLTKQDQIKAAAIAWIEEHNKRGAIVDAQLNEHRQKVAALASDLAKIGVPPGDIVDVSLSLERWCDNKKTAKACLTVTFTPSKQIRELLAKELPIPLPVYNKENERDIQTATDAVRRAFEKERTKLLTEDPGLMAAARSFVAKLAKSKD